MALPRPVPLADASFLYAESRESAQHIGSLMRFRAPEGSPPDYLRNLLQELRDGLPVATPWNRKLATPGLQYNPLHTWVEDKDFDYDYHVRRTAVPAPGDERELGILVARLHASHLDLYKPPWELHVIEGLEDGSYALLLKVHHALADGYTMSTIASRYLSPSPDDPPRMFFNVPINAAPDPAAAAGEALRNPVELLRTVGRGVGSLGALTRALTRLGLSRGPLVGTFQAPDTMFNQKITRNRRFATQQYPMEQLKRIASASGTKLNDVALAVCGGAFRRYLLEQGELPSSPLIAFVPVNVRPKGDPGGGNAVGAMLASMGTDIADPVERLRAVAASTTEAKNQYEGLSREAIMGYSAALMAPIGLQTLGAMTGLGAQKQLFNVTVSNVPGPAQPLYFGNARMEACYPLSIIAHGLALNVTLFSYAGNMHIGFTGCRDTVPHLQKIALYTGDAVAELEQALAPVA